MTTAEDMLPAYHRVVYRRKAPGAGTWREAAVGVGKWQEIAMGVGSRDFYIETIKETAKLIRDDGEDPADYEFRVDDTAPTPWIPGPILDAPGAEQL